MDREEGQIGFVKYSGELVKDGFMDARKSARALLCLDEAVRFFVFQQAPDLRASDFEFPVKVKKGSWEIVVGGIVLAYGVKAAQKMAENDFADIGIKDVVKKALIGIQWVIKIGKHLGDLTIKKFENAKFSENNELIGIRNYGGEYLYVPKKYLDLYAIASTALLKRLSEIVEEERSLSVGVYEDNVLVEETITIIHRKIFTHEEIMIDDKILPELEHGQRVEFEGEVTRGNEMSNTIGIGYKGHVLLGIPEAGSIVRFKRSLFLKCMIRGRVTREDDKGRLDTRRPRIIFTSVEPLENDPSNPTLFK